MRSGKEIQAEIAQVEAELEQARAELEKMQSQASEYEKAQNDDPEWAIARRNYIDTGDMSGVNSWYSRYDQRKRDAFNQKMQEEQLELQKQLANAEAGERASANESTIKNLEYDVEDKKKAYDVLWKRLTNDGKIPFDSLTPEQKIALDGAMDEYNKAIRSLQDVASYSRASKWEKMTDHKQPDQHGAEGNQSKTPEQLADDNETRQALVTRITTIKNKKHEDGKSPRADLDADIAELLEITGKIDSNSSEWQDANNEMNRLKGLKSKEDAASAADASAKKAVDEAALANFATLFDAAMNGGKYKNADVKTGKQDGKRFVKISKGKYSKTIWEN